MAQTAEGLPQEMPAVVRGERRRQGVTLRAIILGLLLVPANVWWVTIIEGKWSTLDGSLGPIFITPVFILLCLAALNFAVRRLKPAWAFNRQELLVVYIMLVISETMNGSDTLEGLMGTIGYPTFFATPENKWGPLFFRFLPRWLFVTDTTALDGFYYGGESMYDWSILSGWVVPISL